VSLVEVFEFVSWTGSEHYGPLIKQIKQTILMEKCSNNQLGIAEHAPSETSSAVEKVYKAFMIIVVTMVC